MAIQEPLDYGTQLRHNVVAFTRVLTSVVGIGDVFTGDRKCRGGSMLMLNADGTVASSRKVANGMGGLPADTLAPSDRLGISGHSW